MNNNDVVQVTEDQISMMEEFGNKFSDNFIDKAINVIFYVIPLKNLS